MSRWTWVRSELGFYFWKSVMVGIVVVLKSPCQIRVSLRYSRRSFELELQ